MEISHRRRLGFSALIVLSATLAAAGFWVWSDRGEAPQAAHVPSQICANTLSGDSAERLLPKSGGIYSEYESGFAAATLGETDTGYCVASVGRAEVKLEYGINYDDNRTRREIAESVRLSAAQELTLGSAVGFFRNGKVVLYLDGCGNAPGDGSRTSVKVFGETSGIPANRNKVVISLAADVLRFASTEALECESASTLPAGDPKKVSGPR